MSEPAKPPRSYGLRVSLSILLGLAVIVGSAGVRTFVEDATGSDDAGWLAGGLVPCLLMLWLAPSVAYRRRDALLVLFIPAALFLLPILWRIAYLPHRDWPEYDAAPTPAPKPAPEPREDPKPAWSRDVTDG